MKFLNKRNAVLSVIGGAAVCLIGWTQNWVTLQLVSSETSISSLESTGQSSSVLPAGLALVAFSTGLVLLSAGRPLAYAISFINFLVASCLGAVFIVFAADPVSFQLKQLTNLTGISDPETLRLLVTEANLGLGLWICALGAIFILIGAVAIATGAHQWPRQKSRYERQALPNKPSSVSERLPTLDAWDEMSRGTDPTS